MAKKITEQLRCTAIRQQLELGKIYRPYLHPRAILYRLDHPFRKCSPIYHIAFWAMLNVVLVFGYHHFTWRKIIHLPAFQIA
jgi:hypothetical protein